MPGKFGLLKIRRTFASRKRQGSSEGEKLAKSSQDSAEIAQLVEHNLAKVGVASSSLVFRSRRQSKKTAFFFCISTRCEISATCIQQNGKICHPVETPQNSPKKAVSTALSNPPLPIDSPLALHHHGM